MTRFLYNLGPLLLAFFCCLWPLLVHVGFILAPRLIAWLNSRMPEE